MRKDVQARRLPGFHLTPRPPPNKVVNCHTAGSTTPKAISRKGLTSEETVGQDMREKIFNEKKVTPPTQLDRRPSQNLKEVRRQ